MKILNFKNFLIEMEPALVYQDMIKVYSDSEKKSNSLSIIEPKTISPRGWDDLRLFTEDGNELIPNKRGEITLEEIFGGFLFDNQDLAKKTPRIIANALNMIAYNKPLQELNPKGEYFILDLGKIQLWNGKYALYPIFIPADREMRKYMGDHFYAVAEKSIFQPKIYAFFYSKDRDQISPTYFAHQALFHLKSAKKKRIEEDVFMNNYQILEPYGPNFVLRIDFSLGSVDLIEKDIERQILKIEKPKKPEESRGQLLQSERGISQISLRPGKKIGLIVPYINKEKFTQVIIKEILNIQEIQNALKFRKGLGELEKVEVSWTIEGDTSGKTSRSVLKRGSKIEWKPKGGDLVVGKISDGPSSFITPDVNLISSGTVPVKLSV
jgi:hypothetical protein